MLLSVAPEARGGEGDMVQSKGGVNVNHPVAQIFDLHLLEVLFGGLVRWLSS